jgi:hypothetical protein
MEKYLLSPAKTLVAKLVVVLLLTISSVSAFAQDTKAVDVNISTDNGGGGFFTSPWVWIVGGAVFILLLVALMRGGSRRDA